MYDFEIEWIRDKYIQENRDLSAKRKKAIRVLCQRLNGLIRVRGLGNFRLLDFHVGSAVAKVRGFRKGEFNVCFFDIDVLGDLYPVPESADWERSRAERFDGWEG